MNFKKYDRFENWKSRRGYSGRKNKMTFDVAESNGKYIIFVEDKVSFNGFNSIWRNISFKDKEDAFNWCEKFADFYKEKRIPKEGTGETGSEKCNSKCDEFIEWYSSIKQED